MTTYWILFALPTFFHLTQSRLNPAIDRIAWIAVAAIFIFILGFRHEVGCDWYGYYSTYEAWRLIPFSELLAINRISRGPAWFALLWISGQTNMGFYGFNLMCATFFCWAIFSFCRAQPLPWLSCLIAVPYLFVVVSMGYVRQGIAIGFLVIALMQIEQHRPWRYSALILAGSLFHISLMAFSPLMLIYLYKKHRPTFILTLIVITGFGLYIARTNAGILDVYFNLETSRYLSTGAIPRVLMNSLPAGILLLMHYRHSPVITHPVWSVVTWTSVLSLLAIPLASTGFDRIVLYLLPVQLYAWSRIPGIFASPLSKSITTLFIIGTYASYQYIWLNFSDHSSCWVPYINIFY